MRWKFVIAFIVGLVGIFYLFTPHETQMSIVLGFGFDHMIHQVIGVVLLLLAVFLVSRNF